MISSLPHCSSPGCLVRHHQQAVSLLPPWVPHENSQPPASVLCGRPEHIHKYIHTYMHAYKQIYHVPRYYVDATRTRTSTREDIDASGAAPLGPDNKRAAENNKRTSALED